MSTSRGAGVHTVPNPSGKGWVNQLRGIQNLGSPFSSKADAEAAGRAVAAQLSTDHTVHTRSGRVSSRTSYGNTDYPDLTPH